MGGSGHQALTDGAHFAACAGSTGAGARIIALLATVALHAMLVASLVLLTGVGQGGGRAPSSSLTVMALTQPPSPAEPSSRSATSRAGRARATAPAPRPVEPIKGEPETLPSAGLAVPATKAEIAVEPSPPPSAPVVKPAEGRESQLREYEAIIWRHIAMHKPRGVQSKGTVTVRFQLDRDGNVLAADVVRSSGNFNLDRIALRAIRQSGAFPQPPAAIASTQLYFVVPIDFR